MLLCWYKTGISAMVLVITMLAALGLHGSSKNMEAIKYIPQTMSQSQVLIAEDKV
jgi:hypothetical protein